MKSGYKKQLITLTAITLSGVLEEVPCEPYEIFKGKKCLHFVAHLRTILSLFKKLKNIVSSSCLRTV